jgi:hypothetical protein
VESLLIVPQPDGRIRQVADSATATYFFSSARRGRILRGEEGITPPTYLGLFHLACGLLILNWVLK